MQEELQAEAEAQHDKENEAEQKKMDKMLRFLENYSRVQESHNLKVQESITAHNSALERIRV